MTNKINFFVFLICIILFFLQSCQIRRYTPIENFCKDLKSEIDRDTLAKFLSLDEDSLSQIYIHLFGDRALKALKENKDLDEYFELRGIEKNKYKIRILLLSFHRVLNNREANLSELITNTSGFVKSEDGEIQKAQKCNEENIKIANETFKKFEIGDTLQLSFPINFQGVRKFIHLYSCHHDYDSDTSQYLAITGILFRKDTYSYDESDKLNGDFYITVAKLNDSNTWHLSKVIGIGDTMWVNLEQYGRVIHKLVRN